MNEGKKISKTDIESIGNDIFGQSDHKKVCKCRIQLQKDGCVSYALHIDVPSLFLSDINSFAAALELDPAGVKVMPDGLAWTIDKEGYIGTGRYLTLRDGETLEEFSARVERARPEELKGTPISVVGGPNGEVRFYFDLRKREELFERIRK